MKLCNFLRPTTASATGYRPFSDFGFAHLTGHVNSMRWALVRLSVCPCVTQLPTKRVERFDGNSFERVLRSKPEQRMCEVFVFHLRLKMAAFYFIMKSTSFTFRNNIEKVGLNVMKYGTI